MHKASKSNGSLPFHRFSRFVLYIQHTPLFLYNTLTITSTSTTATAKSTPLVISSACKRRSTPQFRQPTTCSSKGDASILTIDMSPLPRALVQNDASTDYDTVHATMPDVCDACDRSDEPTTPVRTSAESTPWIAPITPLHQSAATMESTLQIFPVIQKMSPTTLAAWSKQKPEPYFERMPASIIDSIFDHPSHLRDI
jgi:hypothetical protein